jgi:diaminopimelate epimerase
MYNPDGTQAEMCGNGIRCFMKYIVEKGLTNNLKIDVET